MCSFLFLQSERAHLYKIRLDLRHRLSLDKVSPGNRPDDCATAARVAAVCWPGRQHAVSSRWPARMFSPVLPRQSNPLVQAAVIEAGKIDATLLLGDYCMSYACENAICWKGQSASANARRSQSQSNHPRKSSPAKAAVERSGARLETNRCPRKGRDRSPRGWRINPEWVRLGPRADIHFPDKASFRSISLGQKPVVSPGQLRYVNKKAS